MSRWVKGKLRVVTGPELASAGGNFATTIAGQEPPWDEAQWLAPNPPQFGDGSLSVVIDSPSRRHLLAIYSVSNTWTSRFAADQWGFGWAGGFPHESIELDDILPPASSTTGYSEETRGLTVLTDPFPAGALLLDASTGGNVFVEGEAEADYRVRAQGIATS